jgi:AcrR family transcriptional regulator
MTAEILTVARDHLAREGAAALSLRSVARDLGMAPSALYRYFNGRDALLSALILSAYESLAAEAERAAAAAERVGAAGGAGDAQRWAAVPRALRAWALAHPHEWGLVFGTPVPGYEAPQETIAPYARIAIALARPVLAATDAGRLRPGRARSRPRSGPASDPLAASVAPVADAVLPGLPLETVVAVIEAWTLLVGLVSLEVFGHWRNTILEPGLFFEAAISDAAAAVGLS